MGKPVNKLWPQFPKWFRAPFSDCEIHSGSSLCKSCWVINPKRNALKVACGAVCLRLNGQSVKGAALLLTVCADMFFLVLVIISDVLKGSQGVRGQ